jgi:MFS family permease
MLLGMSLFARITLPLAAINFINQANRSLVAVIGPLLALEFGLTAAELGLLAACFFASYAMAQLPIGLALDLKGPRRVQATLALIAATGFVISAFSTDVLMLAAGRCVAGIGVAAGLMAMLKANTQWYPKERVAAVTGAGLFFASMGGLAATMPVQWALPFMGWRGVFAVLAALSVLVSAWVWFSVPNAPPGFAPPPKRSLRQEIGEYRRIFKDPVFLRLVPTVAMLSTLNFTYQGLWAGPWLRDVGGLDDATRAAALFIYSLGMMTGSLLTGQAASFAQARGFSPMLVPYVGVVGCLFAQAMLMLGPGDFWAMALLWFMFSFSGSVGPAGYAAVAQGFPPALAGRVSTAINFLMLCVVFLFQTGIGAILDLWPRQADGGWAPEGYAWALGMTFAVQLAAALWIMLPLWQKGKERAR